MSDKKIALVVIGILMAFFSIFIMWFFSFIIGIIIMVFGFMIAIMGAVIPDDDGRDKAIRAENIRKIIEAKKS